VDSTDAYQLRTTVNPDPWGRGTPGDWNSIMLSPSSTSRGYVTNNDVNVGLTVSHNGRVTLYQSGTALWSISVPRSTSLPGFNVSLEVTSASSDHPTLQIIVNGTSRVTTLASPIPKPYLYLGAYLSNHSTSNWEVSTLSNLQISRVDEYPGLSYFGYYGVDNDHASGNHIADVSGFSNLYFFNIDRGIDNNKSPIYAIEDLKSCPPHSCLLYVGEEFFDPDTFEKRSEDSSIPTG